MGGRPKGTGGKAKELTKDEIRRIDRCLGGTFYEVRNRALFFLGLGSGMRISEICGLRMVDIAPHGKVLDQVVLEKHSTKSKRSRTVYLSKQAITTVQEYIDVLEGELTEETPLFPCRSNPREPMASSSGSFVIKRMFEVAGVANASSHSLRRTHANMLRRHGADLKIIQQQLGHSSLATTERYFRIDPLEIGRAVERLKF